MRAGKLPRNCTIGHYCRKVGGRDPYQPKWTDAQTNPTRHTARLSVTCSVADFATH